MTSNRAATVTRGIPLVDIGKEDININGKLKIDNISVNINKIVTTKSTNLNNYIEAGIYYFGQEYTPTNIPNGVNGWLQVMNNGKTNVVKQIWYRHGTNNTNDFETYVRTMNGNSGWSNWRRLDKYERNVAAGKINENYTLTKKDTYEVLPMVQSVLEGNKLTFENNGIKIGAGVSKIKASAMVHFASVAANGIKWVSISKGTSAQLVVNQTMSGRGSQCICEREINVAQGDIITLQINSNSLDVIKNGPGYTFLRVEVVN